MRGPTLWAALQLAAERPDGSTPSVLISLTQDVETFSAACANLMDSWPENTLPNYWAVDDADDLWTRCLASAADYFTVTSVEYRLLRRGIAVHHGKMPGCWPGVSDRDRSRLRACHHCDLDSFRRRQHSHQFPFDSKCLSRTESSEPAGIYQPDRSRGTARRRH